MKELCIDTFNKCKQMYHSQSRINNFLNFLNIRYVMETIFNQSDWSNELIF